ncbi:MAG: S-adenosylmethionine:tRNA ribosyltransferase-isomerase [Muribaculaceae bacterium]|nr:S-adenosylmethionine:tRNA ribosyltransferase-isomerase [Muribaculaceae bacterium]
MTDIFNSDNNSLIDEVEAIRIEDFDYPLPDERIARHPLEVRDSCRLLVADSAGNPRHHVFSDLPDLLPAGALMIANETRVINARMKFRRPSGAVIEVFILEPSSPNDYVLAFAQRERCQWVCMVGNLKKWKEDRLVREIEVRGIDTPVHLSVRLIPLADDEVRSASRRVEFSWDNPSATFADIVEAAGNIPIPPYLKRDSEESDLSDYQTVYSRVEGSVAAPTAGLHFTPALFGRLEEKGVEQAKVTLHVGAGTFQPVKSEEIGDHPMHTETIAVERGVIESIVRALEEDRDIVAVGTTSVRTIESLPLFGYLSLQGRDVSNPDEMHVEQWTAYRQDFRSRNTLALLRALLDAMAQKKMDFLTGSTAIMIAPGFKWRIASRLITNFHQPQSTLLLLVGSFLGMMPADAAGKGERLPLWRRLYDEALGMDYRFLSYGDACLFTGKK